MIWFSNHTPTLIVILLFIVLGIIQPVIISDIDECDTNTDNCSSDANCTNTDGGFTCVCNTGYTGAGDACQGIYVVSAYLKTLTVSLFLIICTLNYSQILMNVALMHTTVTSLRTVRTRMEASRVNVELVTPEMEHIAKVCTLPSFRRVF